MRIAMVRNIANVMSETSAQATSRRIPMIWLPGGKRERDGLSATGAYG